MVLNGEREVATGSVSSHWRLHVIEAFLGEKTIYMLDSNNASHPDKRMQGLLGICEGSPLKVMLVNEKGQPESLTKPAPLKDVRACQHK
ncbi:hypothetical protein ACTXT7_002899 [Hymenolepis weldensis]